MARNTFILLGDHFEAFISSEIASGKYSSASEVVRTALRLLEQEEEKRKMLSGWTWNPILGGNQRPESGCQ